MATTASNIAARVTVDVAVRSALRGARVMRGTGAVSILGGMPSNQRGTTVRVPYLDFNGEFVEVADGVAATASDFSESYVDATVKRASLGVDINTGAIRAFGEDLMGEANFALGDSFEYFLEKQSTKLLASSSDAMVLDKSSDASVTGDHLDTTLFGKFGDEAPRAVVWLMHSAVAYDLGMLKEGTGYNKPLFAEIRDGRDMMHRNRPILVSDLCPQTFNVGTVTESVPADPNITVTGRALGFAPIKLVIAIVGGGVVGTATFKYSLDNGTTWSATVPTASTIALGTTGLTANFAAGTYTALATSTYTTTYESLLCAKGAGVLWFNGSLSVRNQIDAAKDAEIQFHHAYWAEHVYKKLSRSMRPGVAKLITKSTL